MNIARSYISVAQFAFPRVFNQAILQNACKLAEYSEHVDVAPFFRWAKGSLVWMSLPLRSWGCYSGHHLARSSLLPCYPMGRNEKQLCSLGDSEPANTGLNPLNRAGSETQLPRKRLRLVSLNDRIAECRSWCQVRFISLGTFCGC